MAALARTCSHARGAAGIPGSSPGEKPMPSPPPLSKLGMWVLLTEWPQECSALHSCPTKFSLMTPRAQACRVSPL